MTLLDLLNNVFKQLPIEYGNLEHTLQSIYNIDGALSSTFIEETKGKIVTFKDITSNKNISSLKNNDYLIAILCKKIYADLCSGDESKRTTINRRKDFVCGQYNPKHSRKPLQLIEIFSKDQTEWKALLNEQLERIKWLLQVTAVLKVRKDSEDIGFPSKSNFENQIVKKINVEKEAIKENLGREFDKNCSDIKKRLNIDINDKICEQIIEAYITCAIILIIFDINNYDNDTQAIIESNKPIIEECLRIFLKDCMTTWIEENFPFRTQKQYLDKPAFYIKREDVLKELEEKAFNEDCNQVFAITGERGMGKTTIALDFAAKMAAEKNYQVIVTTYNDSLRDTIINIKRKKAFPDNVSLDERFEQNLKDLKMLCRYTPILVIFDNYDQLDHSAELHIDNDDYNRLLDTKCKILFTSKEVTLINDYAINGNGMELKPLCTEKLVELFNDNVKKNPYYDPDNNRPDVEKLIEKYLYRNTYLVVLSSELVCQGMSAKDVIEAIEELRISNTGLINQRTAMAESRNQTLMEHFCCILDKNKIVHPNNSRERKSVHRILSILGLLPIGGVKDSEFKLVCEPMNCGDEQILKRLIDHNIVFKRDGILYIQPILIEYINRNILLFDDGILDFLITLKNNLKADDMDGEMLSFVRMGESVCKVLWNKDIKERVIERTKDYIRKLKNIKSKLEESRSHISESERNDWNWLLDEQSGNLCKMLKEQSEDFIQMVIDWAAILGIRMSACYTGIDMFNEGYQKLQLVEENAFSFAGIKGLEGLEELEKRRLPAVDNTELAKCAMVFAYALLNLTCESKNDKVAKKYKKANVKAAKKYLIYGKKLLKDVDIYTPGGDLKSKIALTKIHGSLAGCALEKGEYETALDEHKNALKERKELLKIAPESEKINVSRLVGFSLRSIGIVHYFIAEKKETSKEEKIKHYLESYNFHLKSIDKYEENDLDAIGSINRAAGSVLKLVEELGPNAPDSLIKSKINMTFEELAEKICKDMETTFDRYNTCGVDRNVEMKASLERLKTLSDMLTERKQFTQEYKKFIKKLIDIVSNLRTTNDECKKIAHELEEKIGSISLQE